MTSPTFVTNRQAAEMQAMRDEGMLVREIAAALGRGMGTVRRHTVARKGPRPCERNERLLKLAEGRKGAARKALALRNGFASVQSMNVTLCVYRQRMRQAERASV